MSITNFEELEIWKLARALNLKVYAVTKKEPFCKDFGLRDQIRRSSFSVMSNISEGFERGGNKEFYNFLSIAKGSCGEVRCQLYIAQDQEYLHEDISRSLIQDYKKLSIMINKLMVYLKHSSLKGKKYM